MIFTDPRFRSPSALGASYGDALTDYTASPVSSVVGLAVNGAFGYLAWYLWRHKHPIWAAFFGLGAVAGASFNIYKLASR
jgi:hypothetical protein